VKVLVEHFYEIVDGLQVAEVVVVDVHADAEVEACVAAVDDFKIAKLWREWEFRASPSHL